MPVEKTYEEKLARLTEIVDKIEHEVLPLQQTMDLYVEGKKLTEELGLELQKAEELLKETTKN